MKKITWSYHWCRKSIRQSNTHLWLKTLRKIGIEEVYLNLIKSIYLKLIANFMFNGERLNASHLGSETRPRFLLSPILFNVVMEVLVSTVRQEKETKGMQIAKEELKLSLQIIWLCTQKIPKNLQKNSKTNKWISSVKGYKVYKLMSFLYTSNECVCTIIKNSLLNNTMPFKIA